MPNSNVLTGLHWSRLAKYLLFAFAAGSLLLFSYQMIRNINRFQIDLSTYIMASEWFYAGDNPYQDVVRRYIYPQFLLLVVYPLHWLMDTAGARRIAAGIWSLSLLASFFWAVGASWRYLYNLESIRAALKKHLLPTAVLIVMIHPLLQDEFLNGQVNLFILGAVLVFFVLIERKQDFFAAFFLAVAAAIKMAPVLCLVYPLISRRYKSVLYFVPLVLLLTVLLPVAINNESLQYYSYFVTEVMPRITASDFEHGFQSFSAISTASYLFDIHWYPSLKLAVIGLLASLLLAPIYFLASPGFKHSTRQFRFVTFAAIISIIPLTFPMSEAHHLLVQVVPFVVIIHYIGGKVCLRDVLRDRLAMLFAASIVGYHVGHAFKDTPVRLLSLIGVYVGMLVLMARLARFAQLTSVAKEKYAQEESNPQPSDP